MSAESEVRIFGNPTKGSPCTAEMLRSEAIKPISFDDRAFMLAPALFVLEPAVRICLR